MSFLENARNVIKRTVFRKDLDNLAESYDHLLGVLQAYPRIGEAEDKENKFLETVSNFTEWDGQLADLIVRRMRNQDPRKTSVSEETRRMVVDESRRLYVWDVTTQYIIELWTDFGFGQSPDIVPRSEELKTVWRQFWENPSNQYLFDERKVNHLSNKMQIDGELFFIQFINKLDGDSTMRLVETEEIQEIYYDAEDSSIPVYYLREWWVGSEFNRLYYLDYRADEDVAKRARAVISHGDSSAMFAEDVRPETDVLIFHAKYRDVDGRGWPFLTAGFAWSRGYKNFLEDRATINRAAASIVEKVKVKGGQRMVDYVRRNLESSMDSGRDRNPPPASGSIWVENQALDREWISKPTHAVDAEKDGIAILSQVALAGKIYPHYLGRGEYYRLATATAMEAPTYRSFNRYQGFWTSIWRTLVDMVAAAKVKYGGMVFDTFEVDVNTDRIIDTAVKEIEEIINAVSMAYDKGVIEHDFANNVQNSLIKLSMQSLGVPTVSEVIEPEEMAEAIEVYGLMGYTRSIRSATYGMWSGAVEYDEFLYMMSDIIEIGMSRAWRQGMEEVGLSWEERTVEEEAALSDLIADQYSHVPNYADWLMSHNKASGTLLRDTTYRQQLWANAYQKAYNKALQMAINDPKLIWVLGDTKESCRDCLKYSNKIKRASYWRKIHAEPQSDLLECKGINCDCHFEQTDDKLSRGYLTPPKHYQKELE